MGSGLIKTSTKVFLDYSQFPEVWCDTLPSYGLWGWDVLNILVRELQGKALQMILKCDMCEKEFFYPANHERTASDMRFAPNSTPL